MNDGDGWSITETTGCAISASVTEIEFEAKLTDQTPELKLIAATPADAVVNVTALLSMLNVPDLPAPGFARYELDRYVIELLITL